jgi:hypothetical protein
VYLKYKDQMHKMIDDETSSQHSRESDDTKPGSVKIGVRSQQLKNKLRP